MLLLPRALAKPEKKCVGGSGARCEVETAVGHKLAEEFAHALDVVGSADREALGKAEGIPTGTANWMPEVSRAEDHALNGHLQRGGEVAFLESR